MKFWNFNFWSIGIFILFNIVLFFVHLFRIGVVNDGWLDYGVHILKPLMLYPYILYGLVHLQEGAIFVLRVKISRYFPGADVRTNNGIVLKWSGHRHLFRDGQALVMQHVIELLLHLLLHIASGVLNLAIQLLQLLLEHIDLIYQLTWMILASHLLALELLLMHMIYRVRRFFQNFIVQIAHQDGIS
jgi:hypothetical protein